MFNRRMNYLHPLNGEPLQLEEHLKQLKILYEKIEKIIFITNSVLRRDSLLFLTLLQKWQFREREWQNLIPFIPTKVMNNLFQE